MAECPNCGERVVTVGAHRHWGLAKFDWHCDQSASEALRRSQGERCPVPPVGWWCSREPGHDGPCAARPWSMDPEPDVSHEVDRGDYRYSWTGAPDSEPDDSGVDRG